MYARSLPVGNRNMTVNVPLAMNKELRDDLDEFATDVVLDSPSFDNPHIALLERGRDWYLHNEEFTPADAAKRAQILSARPLGGFALQTLAFHAEELFRQVHGSIPNRRFDE